MRLGLLAAGGTEANFELEKMPQHLSVLFKKWKVNSLNPQKDGKQKELAPRNGRQPDL